MEPVSRTPKKIPARCLEQGGNFLDTANGYTCGHSEKYLHNWDRFTSATEEATINFRDVDCSSNRALT